MFTIPIMRTHNHPLQEWYFLPILPWKMLTGILGALDKETNIEILH